MAKPQRLRTRQKHLGTTFIKGDLAKAWSNQGLISSVQLSDEWVKSNKVMTDVVTPGFQQLVAKGRFVNNPASAVTTQYEGGHCGRWLAYYMRNMSDFYSNDIMSNGYKDKFGLVTYPTEFLSDTQRMQALAQAAALAGSEKPSLSSIVAVGEGLKTLNMVLNPLRTVQKLLVKQRTLYERKQMKFSSAVEQAATFKAAQARLAYIRKVSQNLKNPRQRTFSERVIASGDVLSGAVLSINLGWKPVLNDLEALLHTIPKLEQQGILSSRKTESDTALKITLETVQDGFATYTLRREIREESYVRASCFYHDRFNSNQHFGLRIADIPDALWEFVPFSFLVDYVTNVADVIGAWRALLTTDFIGFCTKTMVKQTIDREVINVQPKYSATYGATAIVTHSFEPERLSYEAWTRTPAAFAVQLAPKVKLSGRPPAQLQNVLSLLTQELVRTQRSAPRVFK